MPAKETKEPITEQPTEDSKQKGHDVTQKVVKFLSDHEKEIGLLALGAGAGLLLQRKIDDYIRPEGVDGELFVGKADNGNVKFSYYPYNRFKKQYFLCSWSAEPNEAINLAKEIYDNALSSIQEKK